MAKKKSKPTPAGDDPKSDRHLNPRLPVRVPQVYLDLLAEVARRTRWSKTTTVMVALEDLFTKHGLDPKSPPPEKPPP